MKWNKIVPLAMAAVITTTAAAGAVNLPQENTGKLTYVYESGFRQTILEKYLAWICGQRPEQKPDTEQPDQTPDTDLPEGLPDDGEQQPDAPETELPEEQPEEETPQLPGGGTPEQTPEQTPETPEQDDNNAQGDYASQVVALVNAERAKYGLSALKIDSRVQQAAQVRAAETVQSFSHTRPNGSSFSTALTEAGVSYMRSGENIAYGQSTPQQVVNAWMNSEGHRANILNSSFTTIGVGYTLSGGTAYWAQLFTA